MPGDEEESNPFDKFMNDICKREDVAKDRSKVLAEQTANTPQRRYNDLYRERWQNRIRWSSN